MKTFLKREDVPLEEKDFIHEEYHRNPFLLWKWLVAIITCTLLFYCTTHFYYSVFAAKYTENPFLQVTNREMSVFLWQNPQYMRVHVKQKSSYLPAFEYAERIGLKPEYAEDYVIAPPELLHLYHTWHRLLGNSCIPREILGNEFATFLTAVPEWTSRFWPQAPEGYLQLIERLSEGPNEKLSLLSLEKLPFEVRLAFLGWKNYFFEGDQINQFRPTYEEIVKLLSIYPQYGRNYWCNIVGDSYLKSHHQDSAGAIPANELSGLLRAALFNYTSVSPIFVQNPRS